MTSFIKNFANHLSLNVNPMLIRNILSLITILFSTHITSDLEKCADCITYIKQGKILASDEREAFRKSYISVAGKKEQLAPDTEAKIIGLHTHQLGFEGLMKTQDKELAKAGGFEITEPTLEDIMIHIERR